MASQGRYVNATSGRGGDSYHGEGRFMFISHSATLSLFLCGESHDGDRADRLFRLVTTVST